MLELAKGAYPIRTVFGKAHNARFRHGQVRHVDHKRQVVVLSEDFEMPYDQLAITFGASAAFFGIAGASQFAIPLYSMG
jgi:NADH dehydrogenase FAD-containing subunit